MSKDTISVGFTTHAPIFDARTHTPDADAMRQEAERRLAAEHADASLRIEGLVGYDTFEQELGELWIKGKISGDEYERRILAHLTPNE